MMKLTSLQLDLIKTTLKSRGVVTGYVFGSYARGTAGPLSDLDVGVIFPGNISEEEQGNLIEQIRYRLEQTFGRDKVDVINITTVKNPLLRYMIVLEEGILLYSDDMALNKRIATYTLRSFEDTKHLRNMQGMIIRKIFA